MLESWDELPYWQSGEWAVVQERLDKLGKRLCPARENMFAPLDATPFKEVRVMLVGQDPYPDPELATGIPFEVPANRSSPTLKMILKEYQSDLGFPEPEEDKRFSGPLPWPTRGVLLWNSVPTCEAGKSMSHWWKEWHLLTQQIIEALDHKDDFGVFVFIGANAAKFEKYVRESACIRVSHPSPRGQIRVRNAHPFRGSRLFSTINAKLVEQGLKPIHWKL